MSPINRKNQFLRFHNNKKVRYGIIYLENSLNKIKKEWRRNEMRENTINIF